MMAKLLTKVGLERKRNEIHNALCTRIDEKYFEPLYKDIKCWQSWNALHAMSEAMSCNVEHILLIQECLKHVTRNFLGDKCG